MERCPKCGSSLRIARNYMTFKNDDSADKETEAYTNLEMVCVNADLYDSKEGENAPCSLYAGNDLSKPIMVVATVSHKAN